ncbi:hypothetical protein AB0M43_23695 [Longispora sp. NPDC051575]|uniref:hypothetical protein n=1 Tax=Longispora sp. NPDC051575 TaxID=3154943 RepID=UPI00343252DC
MSTARSPQQAGTPRSATAAPGVTGLPESSGPFAHTATEPVAVRPVGREFRRIAGVSSLWMSAAGLHPHGALVAVSGADGGSGRSTLTAALGEVLAAASPHPLVAIDASLRRWGGLAERVVTSVEATVRDAADQIGDLNPDADLDHLAQRTAGDLRVIIGEPGTGGRRPPTADELAPVVARARSQYALTLLDLPEADAVWSIEALRSAVAPVLVARSTPDSLRHTLRLLHLLRADGYGQVAAAAIVVVMGTVPRPSRDVTAVQRQLRQVAADVHRVPYDPALAKPVSVEVRALRRQTVAALVAVAASVIERCPTNLAPPIWAPADVGPS